MRVRCVSKEAPFPLHVDHAFVLQLIQMVRKIRCADAEFGLNLASNHAVRVSRQQKLSDPKPRFGSDGGKHVSKAGDLFWC